MKSEHPYTNSLINEKSPYLLQHAHNPVNWYSWGEEVFKRAKTEDKPIFLSIGYSTCHWCHVMEEESFTNLEIANIINENFISIKVDREERPDIDNIYMKAVISMNGSGGWPLSLFLTPDLKPFFGGTYLPPEDRMGIVGFKKILISISNLWKEQRNKIIEIGNSLVESLQKHFDYKELETPLGFGIMEKAYSLFHSNFDRNNGGFGHAPKFPMGHVLSFILRYWKRTGESESLIIVEKTLLEIANGGIYDQLGGGFHRYSTDDAWIIPHFEKMLYDQAMLSKVYLEAYQATKKKEYAQIARGIIEYVIREMSHPEGGFYSGEDADSAIDEIDLDKKKEGSFYLWTKKEIIDLLGYEDGEIFCSYFSVKENGNAPRDPHEEFKNQNILYISGELENIASNFNKSAIDIENSIKSSKEKLFSLRSKRPRPERDNKVLVDWNGLMISSLANASRVLCEPGYATIAEKAAQFILKELQDDQGRLLHRYCDGESMVKGMIDDYAFFINGLLDLYEATFDPQYLSHAKRIADEMINLFWDQNNGGFFFTENNVTGLIVRPKEIYDGAIPSGNSIASLDLIRLNRFFIEVDYGRKVETLFRELSSNISRIPEAFPQILIALDFLLGPSNEIVIVPNINKEGIEQILSLIYERFIPNKVIIFRPTLEEEEIVLSKLIPYIKNYNQVDGKSAIYFCTNHSCDLPLTDIKKIEEYIRNIHGYQSNGNKQ